ncbi:MAG: hypothetical protein NXH75_11000 [Halobacteriovoraceae bacterium]|nr:hypothetical protein [Halobacteriovoraceae bacterium]
MDKRWRLILKDFWIFYLISALCIWTAKKNNVDLKNILKDERELWVFFIITFTFFFFIPTPPQRRDFLVSLVVFSLLISKFLGQLLPKERMSLLAAIVIICPLTTLISELRVFNQTFYMDYDRPSKFFKTIYNDLREKERLIFFSDPTQRIYFDPLAGVASKRHNSALQEQINVFIYTPDLYKFYHLNESQINDLRLPLSEKDSSKYLMHEAEISYK